MHGKAWMFAAGVTVLTCATSVAQERQSEVDPQQEAKEIVVRIRKSMREVNKLLLKGSDTDKAVEASEEVVRGLEDLLKEAESSAESVVSGLDELMKIASQSPPSGGGGQGQQKPDPSQQPPNQGAKREKSKDPQELAEQGTPEGSSEKDEPKDSPEDPSKSGDQPQDSPQPDDSPPTQQDAGQAPPGAETGSFQNEDTAGRWGVLPAKEAEDLQRHAVDEFPQRYRHWMDLYYKRVNRSPRR